MKIKIHVDTANLKDIKNYSKIKYIKGITTNPSLMKQAKVKNYIKFCKNTSQNYKKRYFT